MTQVETVATWTGLFTGVAGSVLAVVAIWFSVVVDRRSSKISDHTIQSRLVRADTRDLPLTSRQFIQYGVVRGSRRDYMALVAVPVAWSSVVLLVTAVEFFSERHKYSHGAYTDTFDPLGFSKLLALPLSAVVNAVVPEGAPPEGLPHLAARGALLVVAAFLNAVILLVIGISALLALRWVLLQLRRRIRATR